jgi:hypothetical protein
VRSPALLSAPSAYLHARQLGYQCCRAAAAAERRRAMELIMTGMLEMRFRAVFVHKRFA